MTPDPPKGKGKDMIIDCDSCTVRGRACANCVVTFINGGGEEEDVELDAADVRALNVLANAGVIPPLRYAPAMAKAS